MLLLITLFSVLTIPFVFDYNSHTGLVALMSNDNFAFGVVVTIAVVVDKYTHTKDCKILI